jgi:AraC-like DNA-binding protein
MPSVRDPRPTRRADQGAQLTRVDLSIGSLDLLRFVNYDHDFPRHSHDYFTLGVFDVGSGELRYRRGTWKARDGSILAVPPEEVHEAAPFPRGGWTYRAMYPTREMVALATSDAAADGAAFGAPIFDDPMLARGILRVHRALTAGDRELEVETALLSVLRRLVERHSRAVVRERMPAPSRAVAVAREFIDENYHRPVKLGELASVCATSAFHLVRSFRNAIGLPPHAYLTQVRASRARDLLLSGVSPAHAAYRCGFCDQSHLTRALKRQYGVTPGEYYRCRREGSKSA